MGAERTDATTAAAAHAGYDLMVDWDKRIARESPLFRRVFDEVDARSVLDVGCGTGKLTIEFARWGLRATGVDPDEEMLGRARENAAAAGATVDFIRGGFGELATLGLGPVDVLTCTGNALPHVDGLKGLDDALADFARVVRPAGALVLHLLNHDRLLRQRPRTLPVAVRDARDCSVHLFARLLSYEPQDAPVKIRIEFLTATREAAALGKPDEGGEGEACWAASSRAAVHTVITSGTLVDALTGVGFGSIQVLGDHSGRAFEPQRDESIVVVARRDSV